MLQDIPVAPFAPRRSAPRRTGGSARSASRRLAALAIPAAIGLAGLISAPSPAAAQAWPAKPIRWIVPFAAGGIADVLSRTVGAELEKAVGQPVVVENKVGAAGTIGVETLARAAPDGYTVGVIPAGNIAVNPSLFKSLPYKAADLAPVTMLATAENVLVVSPAVGVDSLKALVERARSGPGSISYASPGAGSQAHLAGELLALRTGTRLTHVAYKGTAPAITDLLGGHVSVMFSQVISALEPIRSGKLKALGVASPKRNPLLPDVPTIAEQDLPGFEAVSWYALMVPAGTPKPVVDRLQDEVSKILKSPAVSGKLSQLGADVDGGTSAALAATIQRETERWAEVIRKQNIPLQ